MYGPPKFTCDKGISILCGKSVVMKSVENIMEYKGFSTGDPVKEHCLEHPKYMNLSWKYVIKKFNWSKDWITLPFEVIHKNMTDTTYIKFYRDSIKSDITAFITLNELFNEFRGWRQDHKYTDKMPTKTEFKENFNKASEIKADTQNKWHGIKFTNQQNTTIPLSLFYI